jgi:hypothetical protein
MQKKKALTCKNYCNRLNRTEGKKCCYHFLFALFIVVNSTARPAQQANISIIIVFFFLKPVGCCLRTDPNFTFYTQENQQCINQENQSNCARTHTHGEPKRERKKQNQNRNVLYSLRIITKWFFVFCFVLRAQSAECDIVNYEFEAI